MALVYSVRRSKCFFRFLQCASTSILLKGRPSHKIPWHGRFCCDQKIPCLRIEDESDAKNIIENLSSEERDRLKNAIIHYVPDISKNSTERIPTYQLKQLFYANAVPLIGFGFLDNALMIIAGEYLDQTLGTVLAISTMAAAGLGHIFADLAGMALTHYVEFLATKTGLKQPFLTPAQRELPAARKVVNFGRATGLIVGCLIGMLPLLFYDNPRAKYISKDKTTPEDPL